MGRQTSLIIEKDNKMISFKECAELLGISISRVQWYYYHEQLHTFNDIKKKKETVKRGHDFQNFYILYSLKYPFLPVYYGDINEISKYLGYKDTNSVNLIFNRLSKGKRNGIARDKTTGVSYTIAKFKASELENDNE